ncbi:hypothetical protein [Paraburkholderia sp. BCC1886]|uniref:hypothetical protein n=1 Tax=Paraburkholderia sp. BCC1886 TaxID=2562670 RepID=UPI0011838FF2|nr:hypothetical protein [Paraburkholderia sp. BCC1886]
MTCIVYTENRLYADSRIVKGTELFDSLSKIKRIHPAMEITSSIKGFEIQDRILGFAGTGGQPAMEAFVTKLRKVEADKNQSFETVFEFYQMVAEQALVVETGNIFELLMIGERFNHQFAMRPDGFQYTKVEKDVSLAYGSGAKLFTKFVAEHGDPIRAMYETFRVDPHSGGMIDVWEFDAGDEHTMPSFNRVGMAEGIPSKSVGRFLSALPRKLLPLTYVRKSALDRVVAVSAEDNAEYVRQLDEREAKESELKATIKELRKKLAAERRKNSSTAVVTSGATGLISLPPGDSFPPPDKT